MSTEDFCLYIQHAYIYHLGDIERSGSLFSCIEGIVVLKLITEELEWSSHAIAGCQDREGIKHLKEKNGQNERINEAATIPAVRSPDS